MYIFCDIGLILNNFAYSIKVIKSVNQISLYLSLLKSIDKMQVRYQV